LTQRYHVWVGFLPQRLENRYLRGREEGGVQLPSLFFRDIGIRWRKSDMFTSRGPRWSGLMFAVLPGRHTHARAVVRSALRAYPEKFGGWAHATRSLRLSTAPPVANTAVVVAAPAIRPQRARAALRHLGTFTSPRGGVGRAP